MVGRLLTDVDLEPVMPYIDTSVKNAFYDAKVPAIVYNEGEYKYEIRDGVISIKNFNDRAHAERVAKKAVEVAAGLFPPRTLASISWKTPCRIAA
jgi:hypothetical protein